VPPVELLAPLAAIAFGAGVIQGLSGFGSALVAVPLFALILPVETLVPLMALLGAGVSAFNLIHLRAEVRLRPVVRLLFGYLLGTPLGLYFLARAPEVLVLGTLGVFLCGYALLALIGRQPRANWLREWRVTLGAVSGALGAAFSTNGPPVILHVAAHPEWGAHRQKATLVLFLLLASVITVGAHGASGLITAEVLRLLLWAAPTLVLGTLAGLRLYARLGNHGYQRLVFGLILATGLLMLGRSLAGVA
jgi:uncharacterized membrane protein YfcA